MHKNWSTYFCPMNGVLENALVCSQFSSKLSSGKVYALSRSYLDCLGYFSFFSILCPNCALGALRYCNVCSSIYKAKIFCFSGTVFYTRFKYFNQRIVPKISLNLILFKKTDANFFALPHLFFPQKSARETEDKVFWSNMKHFILYIVL